MDSKAIRALLLSIERFIMSVASQKKNLNCSCQDNSRPRTDVLYSGCVIKQLDTAVQHALLISKATRLEDES